MRNTKKENKPIEAAAVEGTVDWSETLLSLGLNDREKDEINKHKPDLLNEKRYFEKFVLLILISKNFFRIVKALINIKVLLGNHVCNFENNIYNEIQSILSTEQYAKLMLFLEKVFNSKLLKMQFSKFNM